MVKPVTDLYEELWHYTTASGLQGILESRELWATHISYLNDIEEFTGFFDSRLLKILEDGVNQGLEVAMSSEVGKQAVAAKRGAEFLRKEWPGIMLPILRKATIQLSAYIASFCYTPKPLSEDGLLSQWRGYGRDGGYAIVFDTKKLKNLLDSEHDSFLYSFVHWGDVDYYDKSGEIGTNHEEVEEWEKDLRDVISRFIQTPGINAIMPIEMTGELFKPIISLSTRHKHRGFREENEVRVAAIRAGTSDVDAARKLSDTRPLKTVRFVQRDGVLVPYIALFEKSHGDPVTLPINKIVVGPHPDKVKRANAIKMMLSKFDIEAKVEVSGIPYIGR